MERQKSFIVALLIEYYQMALSALRSWRHSQQPRAATGPANPFALSIGFAGMMLSFFSAAIPIFTLANGALMYFIYASFGGAAWGYGWLGVARVLANRTREAPQ